MSETEIHMDHKAVGRKVAQYRQSFAGVGMSQVQLAERTGLNRHTIRNYENGRGMTFESALKIADALGVSICDLIERVPSDVKN